MFAGGVGALVLLSTLMIIRRRSAAGKQAPDCAGGGATGVQPAALLNSPRYFSTDVSVVFPGLGADKQKDADLNELKAWGEKHNVSLGDVTSKSEAMERIRRDIEVLEARLQADETIVDVQLGYGPRGIERGDAPLVRKKIPPVRGSPPANMQPVLFDMEAEIEEC